MSDIRRMASDDSVLLVFMVAAVVIVVGIFYFIAKLISKYNGNRNLNN